MPEGPTSSASFDIRFMEPGKRSTFLFLPPEYLPSIGLVVAHWGTFEMLFDRCLEALVAAAASSAPIGSTGRKNNSFPERAKRFKLACTSVLQPAPAERLIAICDFANDLRKKRNMVAHGIYHYSILPHSSVATKVVAFDPTKNDSMLIDDDTLKKLWHEISHLTAELHDAFSTIGQIEAPFALIADADLLRVYDETIHPWNPDPAKRPAI